MDRHAALLGHIILIPSQPVIEKPKIRYDIVGTAPESNRQLTASVV
jgi:hypothetical protein